MRGDFKNTLTNQGQNFFPFFPLVERNYYKSNKTPPYEKNAKKNEKKNKNMRA